MGDRCFGLFIDGDVLDFWVKSFLYSWDIEVSRPGKNVTPCARVMGKNFTLGRNETLQIYPIGENFTQSSYNFNTIFTKSSYSHAIHTIFIFHPKRIKSSHRFHPIFIKSSYNCQQRVITDHSFSHNIHMGNYVMPKNSFNIHEDSGNQRFPFSRDLHKANLA